MFIAVVVMYFGDVKSACPHAHCVTRYSLYHLYWCRRCSVREGMGEGFVVYDEISRAAKHPSPKLFGQEAPHLLG